MSSTAGRFALIHATEPSVLPLSATITRASSAVCSITRGRNCSSQRRPFQFKITTAVSMLLPYAGKNGEERRRGAGKSHARPQGPYRGLRCVPPRLGAEGAERVGGALGRVVGAVRCGAVRGGGAVRVGGAVRGGVGVARRSCW